jgi:hypothetical protein
LEFADRAIDDLHTEAEMMTGNGADINGVAVLRNPSRAPRFRTDTTAVAASVRQMGERLR